MNKTIEELEKICKKIQLKKRIKLFFYLFFIATVLIGFAYYAFYEETKDIKKVEKPRAKVVKIKKQNNPKKIVHTKITTIKKLDKEPKKIEAIAKNKIQVTKKIKKSSTSDQCFTIQYLTTKDFNRVIKLKKRLMSYHIKQCYTLLPENNSGFYALRCGLYSSREESKKYEKIAKDKNLDYLVFKERCDYLKSLMFKQKKIKQPEKDKNISKPVIIKKVNNLIKTKTYNVKELEKIYNRSKSYDIALKIAQLYYKDKKYDNSLKWAKIANMLDKKDDKSWIIYAKSLYAKGDVKSAKKILHIYLRFSSSKSVKNLLKKWEQ